MIFDPTNTQTNLVNPLGSRFPIDEVHLLADLGDLCPEVLHGCPGVLDAREDVREEAVQERNVLSNQLGHHGLAHTLDQDLREGGRVMS